jgi:hypothetical protein
LQEQAGHRAEIVLGVVNDERLEDRVQVILVVTGMGAPTLEETLSKVDQSSRNQVHTQSTNTSPATRSLDYALTPSPEAEQRIAPASTHLNTPSHITSKDLDIPAFLRKAR